MLEHKIKSINKAINSYKQYKIKSINKSNQILQVVGPGIKPALRHMDKLKK